MFDRLIPIFVFCSPCCDDCPTVYRKDEGYVILDPDRPERGEVSLSSAALDALVGQNDSGLALTWKEGTAINTSLLAQPLAGVSIFTTLVDGQDMVRLQVGVESMLFLPHEWNALFDSADARRTVIDQMGQRLAA